MFSFFRLNKKSLLQCFLAFIMLVCLSFALEYSIFDSRLFSLSKEQQITTPFNLSIASLRGFAKTPQHTFFAKESGATLTLPIQDVFTKNIMVELPQNNRNYAFTLSFLDTNGRETTLQSEAGKILSKRKLQTLPFLVFPLNARVQSITIATTAPLVEIQTIAIDNASTFNSYRFAFFFCAGFLFGCLIFFRKNIGQKPEYAFLVIALVCGGLIAFSETHSFVSWDEFIHYKRADNLSLKNIVPKRVNDIYAAANAVPHSVSLKEQAVLDTAFDTNTKSSNQTSKKKNQKENSLLLFSPFKLFQNIAYIPSGIALFISHLLHIPAHFGFLFGRFVNLLAFVGLSFFALQKIRHGKLLLATIALFPTSLFLAANYGYDAWLTGCFFLGSAWLFTELSQPTKLLSRKELFIILFCFVLGLSAKAIYFPLLFLLFLLPTTKFSSSKEYRFFLATTLITILFVLASFILPFFFEGHGGNDRRGGKEVNSSQQIHFILTHPLEYTHTLLSFVREYINPLNAQGLTVSFAYLGSIQGFYWVLFLLLLVLLFEKRKPLPRLALTRFITLTLFFVTVCLIATALFIAFTPVGLNTINGVQPRYLIPLLFPLLFPWSGYLSSKHLNQNTITLCVFTLITCILLFGIWSNIISLYY
jgi:uncharacterized membrane protein